MTRTHAAFIALAVALAAIAGTFAALRTTQLGASAHTPTAAAATIAARTHALDRTEHALLAALRRKPPALPKLVHPSHAGPAAAPIAAAPAPAPAPRIVYRRPAPIVHVIHRHGEPGEGSEHGDGGGGHGGDGGGGGGDD